MLNPEMIAKLKGALTKAWAQDSDIKTSWNKRAVAACLVQDAMGGEIVDTTAVLPGGTVVPHFFNKIDGRYYDLTRDELPKGTFIRVSVKTPPNEKTTPRDYILSSPETRKRYDLLRKEIE